MKKKIAVVFNHMIVGGAEKALINFLNALDTSTYDITLFTYNDKGAYFSEIPSDVRICFTECPDTKQQLIDDITNLKICSVIKGLFWRSMLRLCWDEYIKLSCAMKACPKLDGNFDCAVAYKMNYPDTATVLWRIDAKKKCSFIHGDLPDDASCFLKIIMRKLDQLFCVSELLKNRIHENYRCARNKAVVMHNMINATEIICKADACVNIDRSKPMLTTVGRLSPEKGQQMVPKTVRLLLDAGYDIHWYLVGDGPLREEIEEEIRKYGVADRVILLGTKLNPYPYIKNCDIYVQPSFSEGYCTTTMEAKILCKPIVTTDAPGMREQFVSGENGLIVDAMTPEALFEGIRTLLDHPEMMEKFRNALKSETYDNASELQKLYDFIES